MLMLRILINHNRGRTMLPLSKVVVLLHARMFLNETTSDNLQLSTESSLVHPYAIATGILHTQWISKVSDALTVDFVARRNFE